MCVTLHDLCFLQELQWEVEQPGGVLEVARGSLWALTLSCLQALLEDAPGRRWRAFNQQQLHRHDFLRLLLAACKVRTCGSHNCYMFLLYLFVWRLLYHHIVRRNICYVYVLEN